MSIPTQFKNVEDAYESIKRGLTAKDYSVDEFKTIDYGIQFKIEKSNDNELVRVYSSKKKGITVDTSQVKTKQAIADLNQILTPRSENPDSRTLEKAATTYSLNVGINKFEKFEDMEFAEKDATVLNQKISEKFGLGDGNYRLINKDARKEEIIDRIQKIAEIAQPQDMVFMSFSTHGEVIKSNDEDSKFYLLTSDSKPENLAKTSLPMDLLKSETSKIKAERKIVVLDTCYSGGIARSGTPSESSAEKEIIFRKFVEPESDGFVMITSCKPHQSSWECRTLKHGVFTHFLLNGLCGAVESKNGSVEVATLYLYLFKSVSEHVKKTFSANQNPKFFGNFTGNFRIPLLVEANDTEPNRTNQKKPHSFERTKCVGIDESGKGDYFGPLTVAAVYVDKQDKISELINLGIKDSKKLSDKKIRFLAEKIKSSCDSEVVCIKPTKYNELWDKMGNLNDILAWSHAQSLEKVLKRNPECKLAISDKFASKYILMNRLKIFGKAIELVQRPKAEENISVAAASILARDAYLSLMEQMEEYHDTQLMRGASENVVKPAAEFLIKYGNLRDIAKVHFKTTKSVIKEYEKTKESQRNANA